VVCRQVAAVTKANVSFGLIPSEDWYQPGWIDEEKAKAGRRSLNRILYMEVSPHVRTASVHLRSP
jgi:hypothetical protein